MADYYDRLGAQLADLTEQGSRRRWAAPPHLVPRMRTELVAVPVAVFLVIAVSALFLALGSNHGTQHASRPVGAGGASGSGTPVIRNYAHARVPPQRGRLVCDAKLDPPSLGKSPSGVSLVFARGRNRNEISITATGLKPNTRHDVYAVWLAVWLAWPTQTQPDTFKLVGIAKPAVGPDGKLVADGVLPRGASGSYQLLITLQPSASVRAPGRTVLEGSISF